jgi:hypothetical protein
MNRTIPDLFQPNNHVHWRMMEAAKHGLFYTLLKLKLPLATAVFAKSSACTVTWLIPRPTVTDLSATNDRVRNGRGRPTVAPMMPSRASRNFDFEPAHIQAMHRAFDAVCVSSFPWPPRIS